MSKVCVPGGQVPLRTLVRISDLRIFTMIDDFARVEPPSGRAQPELNPTLARTVPRCPVRSVGYASPSAKTLFWGRELVCSAENLLRLAHYGENDLSTPGSAESIESSGPSSGNRFIQPQDRSRGALV